MSMIELVQFHGYPIMEYRVTTADGYILELHRIPGKHGTRVIDNLKEMRQTPKQTVLFMHGLFNNAESWVITGTEEGKGKALPY